MSKKALALFAFLLGLLGTSNAFAVTANWSVTPDRIPPDGMVTITILNTDTVNLIVDKIVVTDPDGTEYTKDYAPDKTLTPSDSFSEQFGTGVGGWSPAADTSQGGKYKVHIYGPEKVSDYFDVSDMFCVPESTLPTALVTGMGFALLLCISRKTKVAERV